MNHHKYRLVIPFLLPALILYGVFVLFPYGRAIYISLTSWRGVSANMPFVGMDNYTRLLNETRFMEALSRNGQLLIVLPIVTIGIALTFAALFTQGGAGIRGSGFYRVVFFFPQVISAVIVGMLFTYVYNPTYGLLNAFLDLIGLDTLTRAWLGNASTVLWAIAAVAIWSSVGFYMVIFMASMQSIPTSFYEAAVLDGATRWRQFRDITLPLMWETIRTALIYIAIAALDFFTLVQVMTGGGSSASARKAEVAAIYMYNEAFGQSRWGSASAVGVILLILTLLLSVIVMRATRRETYEF
ncbi:MAG TPA: sugar ABC transporter permease [Thermomicrobiales bacterium]|nr:sugar ABC transporter permease [Thermomicrobiales bacterium]